MGELGRPVADRVIVKRIVQKEVKKGDLFIPDMAVEKPAEGHVMAVGNGIVKDGERIPVDAAVNDHILFGKYSGVEVVINDDPYLVLKEDEILVILPE